MRRMVIILVAAAVLAPAGLAAQGRVPPGHRAQMIDRPGPLGGHRLLGQAMAFAPGHLLARRHALELTDQQIERLEALEEDMVSARTAARSGMREHGDALRDAWQEGEGDAAAIASHARALMEARQSLHLVQLNTALQARSVLDDGQRGRVQGWMDGRRALRRQTRPGARRIPGEFGRRR